MLSVRIIGGGRAGKSLGTALESAGWELLGYLGRDDDLSTAAVGTNVLVIANSRRRNRGCGRVGPSSTRNFGASSFWGLGT